MLSLHEDTQRLEKVCAMKISKFKSRPLPTFFGPDEHLFLSWPLVQDRYDSHLEKSWQNPGSVSLSSAKWV